LKIWNIFPDAKKSRSSNLPADVYATAVHSYTHGNVNQVVVSKEFLHSGEHVLLIDDFLAHGEALAGLVSLVQQAGGTASRKIARSSFASYFRQSQIIRSLS